MNAFDASDPVHTPNTLDTTNPQVQLALGDAIHDLTDNGFGLDATVGDLQYLTRNGERIPIHGGAGTLGLFNAINTSWNPANGYASVPHGSSFVHSVEFDGDPCPDAATILTYSQSSDSTSPRYDDQTRLFSAKQWVTDRFCEADIAASPVLTTLVLAADAGPSPLVPEAPWAVLLPLVGLTLGGVVLRRRASRA